MEKIDSYFKGHDNHRLYYESYHPKRPKGVLVFVHGLNEHVGRYEHVVDEFSKDYVIYLFDHRGHGKSDGIRSHVEKFEDYVRDLHEFVKTVHKNEKKLNIFLVAHSMGGQVLLNYLYHYPKDPVQGFITSSANIRVALKLNPIKKILGMKLADYLPKLKVPNDIKTSWVSRDPDIVKAYEKDPLVGKGISLSLAREIINNQDEIMEHAAYIKKPALMMHAGDDKICSKEGTVEFYNRLGSKDKSLHIFDDMYHEIFNDPEREDVFNVMKAWLKNH